MLKVDYMEGDHVCMYQGFSKPMEKQLTLEIDYNFHGWSVAQLLPYAEVEFDKTASSETIIATPDDAEIGSLVEVNLKYFDRKKKEERTKNLALCSESKIVEYSLFKDYTKNNISVILNLSKNCYVIKQKNDYLRD